jgi:acyl-CoA synthetase (AMP-forming)/AMP-acid ligase II
MNLRDFIESRVEKNPSKPFLYFEEEVTSYEDFNQKINQAANGFLGMGVKKGDRVCLMLSNRPEFLYGWFGLAKIGAVMVPINTNFKESEAGYIAHHSEAVGMVVDWCKDRLANFKVPRYVLFRSSLPKTSTERIAKYLLKQEKDILQSAFDMERYKKMLLKKRNFRDGPIFP